MLTVRKQPAAFVMLLLVALPLILAAGMYLKQQLIQYQRIQRFKTSLLETITIKAEKLDWVEAGKEIRVDGNLFDVESFKRVGSDMILTGFYDYKEQELLKQIKRIEQQKNKSGSPLNQFAVKFLFLPNYKELSAFSIQNNWQNIVTSFPEYTESISNIAHPAVAPPPKNC